MGALLCCAPIEPYQGFGKVKRQKKKGNYNVVVILGEPGVGKTTILSELTGARVFFPKGGIGFDESEDSLERERRTDKIIMIGTDMQLKIWLKVPTEEELDTVDLQNLINAVVIVFDVTNKASFDQLIKWVRLSSHFSNGILVGNKSDLSKNRQVSSQDAEMMAIRYDMKYIEVSSKTRRGIPDLMDKIVDIIGPDESSLRLNR